MTETANSPRARARTNLRQWETDTGVNEEEEILTRVYQLDDLWLVSLARSTKLSAALSLSAFAVVFAAGATFFELGRKVFSESRAEKTLRWVGKEVGFKEPGDEGYSEEGYPSRVTEALRHVTKQQEELKAEKSRVSALEARLAAIEKAEREERAKERIGVEGRRNNRQVCPVGAVVAWPHQISSNRLPEGWLLCDGATYPSGDYPQLYSALKESGFLYEVAQGAGERPVFKVPDYRGYFLRGAGGESGRDPGPRYKSGRVGNSASEYAGVGSEQGQGTLLHDEVVVLAPSYGRSAFKILGMESGEPTYGRNGLPASGRKEQADQANDAAWWGTVNPNETRPRNIAVHWLIRAR